MMGSPVAGFRVGKVLPDTLVCHSLLMKIPVCCTVTGHRLQQRDEERSELGHLDIGRRDGLRQGSGGHAARRLAHALHQLLRPGAPMVGLQSEHF